MNACKHENIGGLTFLHETCYNDLSKPNELTQNSFHERENLMSQNKGNAVSAKPANTQAVTVAPITRESVLDMFKTGKLVSTLVYQVYRDDKPLSLSSDNLNNFERVMTTQSITPALITSAKTLLKVFCDDKGNLKGRESFLFTYVKNSTPIAMATAGEIVKHIKSIVETEKDFTAWLEKEKASMSTRTTFDTGLTPAKVTGEKKAKRVDDIFGESGQASLAFLLLIALIILVFCLGGYYLVSQAGGFLSSFPMP